MQIYGEFCDLKGCGLQAAGCITKSTNTSEIRRFKVRISDTCEPQEPSSECNLLSAQLQLQLQLQYQSIPAQARVLKTHSKTYYNISQLAVSALASRMAESISLTLCFATTLRLLFPHPPPSHRPGRLFSSAVSPHQNQKYILKGCLRRF
jgi:hypothetical protein